MPTVQKLEEMRTLAKQQTTIYLDMPDFRAALGRPAQAPDFNQPTARLALMPTRESSP
jgi:hypothetical protein